MLGDMAKIFFGNIASIIGWIFIILGIIVIFWNFPAGVIMIVIGVLLISVSSALKGRTRYR